LFDKAPNCFRSRGHIGLVAAPFVNRLKGSRLPAHANLSAGTSGFGPASPFFGTTN
jgi:hypothetical protein